MSETNDSLTPKKKMPVSPGRPKGVPNQTTKLLRDCILLAADDVGQDGAGKDGLRGYLRHVAMTNVPAFASLMGKVLPLQVNANVSVEHTSKEQKDAAVQAFMRAAEEEQRQHTIQ